MRQNQDYLPPYLERMLAGNSAPASLRDRTLFLAREFKRTIDELARHVESIQRDCHHPEIKHHERKCAEDDSWDQCMVCGLIAGHLDNEEMRQATRRLEDPDLAAAFARLVAGREVIHRYHGWFLADHSGGCNVLYGFTVATVDAIEKRGWEWKVWKANGKRWAVVGLTADPERGGGGHSPSPARAMLTAAVLAAIAERDAG